MRANPNDHSSVFLIVLSFISPFVKTPDVRVGVVSLPPKKAYIIAGGTADRSVGFDTYEFLTNVRGRVPRPPRTDGPPTPRDECAGFSTWHTLASCALF